MSSNLLIYVIYQSVGWPPKGLDKSLLMNCQASTKFVLTARQYGEVVLPDAATGQSIVPLGPGIVPVQGGYGALFAIMLQILLGSGAIAEQV